jgi:ATP adenylyltransferase
MMIKRLFAPWRTAYTTNTAHQTTGNETKDECVFCAQLTENNDQKYFVLKRTRHWAIMLNRYPYNAGHLLIVALTHVATLQDLTQEARTELIELTTQSSNIIQHVLQPGGLNIGLNLGKIAGAGLPAHIHLHILPRWLGDTNFMPVFGETKVISFDLTQVYLQLKPHFDSLV